MISGLIVALVLTYMAGYAVQLTWNFYTIEKSRWSEKEVGYSLMFVGAMVAAVHLQLFPGRPVHRGKRIAGNRSVHSNIIVIGSSISCNKISF